MAVGKKLVPPINATEKDVIAALPSSDWDAMLAATDRLAGAQTPHEAGLAAVEVLAAFRPARKRSGRNSSSSRRDRVLDRDGHQCVSCHSTDDLELDHLFPAKFGGSCQDWNIACLCTTCNNVKGSGLAPWALRLMVKQARETVADG